MVMCLGATGTPQDLYIAMGYIKCDCGKWFAPWNRYNAYKECVTCYDKAMERQPFVDG
jgi:hypothetical protein